MFSKFFITIFALISLVACGEPNSSPFTPVPPKPSGVDPDDDARNFGDYIRDKTSYDPVLLAVTREYGYTVISTKALPIRSELAQANVKPWSSWWFPKKDPYLFTDSENGLSPLRKYDMIRRARDRNAASARIEEQQAYNSNASAWEGLCDAWAIASISMPEPVHPVSFRVEGRDVTFNVGDLKALILKTYEAAEDSGLKYYGQKFTGDSQGWIYPDLFPEQFHRFVEMELFKNKRAFVMDHDPGFQVWNVPVYKANYLIEAIPNQPDDVFVRMWVYSATSTESNEKSFVGTKETMREYDYVLSGKRNANGDLVIQSGYWVKGPTGVDSRKDHPDYVIQIANPKALVRKSWNSQIDVKLVDDILGLPSSLTIQDPL